MSIDAVVKVGGSLLSVGAPRSLVEALADVARHHRLVLVPGGGPFADMVREVSARHAPGPGAAHWMAILAMDQHAHLLAAMSARASLCATGDECAALCAQSRLAVLAPYAWLRSADPLPHAWDVTSDSLAAWVAGRLQARRLLLLKALDGLSDGGDVRSEAALADAVEAGIVDASLPSVLAPGIECWLLSGRHPDRVRELLVAGNTRGTRLRP